MTLMRSARVLTLAALCAGLLVARPAHAQAPLIDGFGGTVGYGTECLSPNDDGTSAPVDITSAFPNGLLFFGHQQLPQTVPAFLRTGRWQQF